VTATSTARDVIDALIGPPDRAVVAAIADDANVDALASHLERELDRLPDAPTHRLHVVSDAASASAAARATRTEPTAIHVVTVRDGTATDVWRLLDRGRSRHALAVLLLVLSPTSYAEARRAAPNLASLSSLSTHHVSRRMRVVAHPMHEHEHSAVFNAVTSAQQLDESLVVGEMDATEVEQLRAQNIIVDVYGPAEPAHRATLWSATDASPAAHGPWPDEFEASIDLAAVTLLAHRPIPGVTLIEPRGHGRYCLRVDDPAAYAALSACAGVGAPSRIEVVTSASAFEKIDGPSPWLVLLRDAAHRAAVEEKLVSAGATILRADGRALRVDALPSTIDQCRRWPEVRRVDDYVEPTLSADIYRQQVGLESVDPAGALVETLTWDGTGEVVGVADSGIDAAHPALRPAIHSVIPLARSGDGSDLNGHGTHVAGIIAGRGVVQTTLRGAAPGAQLVVQCIVDANDRLTGLPADLTTLLQEAYDLDVRVHNNSWGAAVEGRYDAQAEQIDEFVCTHRDMLVVIAAGNRGRADKPVDRTPSAEAGWVEYRSLDAPAVAKNALTVGACRSGRSAGGRAVETWGARWSAEYPDDPVRSQHISGDPQSMAAFSSRGPVESSRIKPDLVAPGTDIASTWPEGHPGDRSWGVVPNTQRHYRYLGGTSMAAPIVAGCAARVRQYFRDERSHRPSAALLKATLMNGARPLTGADANHRHPAPNFHQGFGCVDMRRTVPATGADFALAFEDPWEDASRWFDHRKRFRARFELTTPMPLGVCLAWTDPSGPGRSSNLALVVELPDGSKRRGNDERAGKIPEQPDDEANTVVAVRLPTAPAGVYTVMVLASTLLRGPQDYALVVTGALDARLLFDRQF